MNRHELRQKGREYAEKVIKAAKKEGSRIVGVGPLIRQGTVNSFMLTVEKGGKRLGFMVPFDNKVVAKAAYLLGNAAMLGPDGCLENRECVSRCAFQTKYGPRLFLGAVAGRGCAR